MVRQSLQSSNMGHFSIGSEARTGSETLLEATNGGSETLSEAITGGSETLLEAITGGSEART